MKYISRNKVYERKEPSKTAKKIYIFCEGKKEVEYFKYFNGLVSIINIIALYNEDGKSDPVKLREKAEEYFFGSQDTLSSNILSHDLEDEVWFVIDTDRWNEGGKIDELKKYIQEKNQTFKAWNIAQSNPCFEIWLYYHFFKVKPIGSEVEMEENSSFKEFVNNKIRGGFDTRKMPVHIQEAILNSRTNFTLENDQPAIFCTNAYVLGEEIVRFTKEQLDQMLLKSQNES